MTTPTIQYDRDKFYKKKLNKIKKKIKWRKQMNNQDKELIDEVRKLVRLGLLDEVDNKFIDSKYSKDIDKMTPRRAFLEGLYLGEKEGYKQALENVKKLIEKLAVKKFKPFDEEDEFHMKGWNDSLEELKEQINKMEKTNGN